MKKIIFSFIVIAIFFVSCTDKEEDEAEIPQELKSYFIYNSFTFPIVNSKLSLIENKDDVAFVYNIEFIFSGVPINIGDIEGGIFSMNIVSSNGEKIALGDYPYFSEYDSVLTYNSAWVRMINHKHLDENLVSDISPIPGALSVTRNDSIYGISFWGKDSIENNFEIQFNEAF